MKQVTSTDRVSLLQLRKHYNKEREPLNAECSLSYYGRLAPMNLGFQYELLVVV